MNKVFTASRYLRHKLLGTSRHGIHSPFVFDLFNKVILDNTPYYFYDDIESLRSRLLLDNRLIEVHDFGTGGIVNPNRSLKVSYIAQNFLQSKRNAQLISRLVTHFKPREIIELGTSLGITSLYMAKPDRNTKVISLEGCPNTSRIASENFASLRVKNIEIINKEFDLGLPEALKKTSNLDLVYFDGNHSKDATIKYFELCLDRKHDETLFIFDDIHWSREMNSAWTYIKKNQAVSLSIDLFQLGLIFFKRAIHKQHFNLKY